MKWHASKRVCQGLERSVPLHTRIRFSYGISFFLFLEHSSLKNLKCGVGKAEIIMIGYGAEKDPRMHRADTEKPVLTEVSSGATRLARSLGDFSAGVANHYLHGTLFSHSALKIFLIQGLKKVLTSVCACGILYYVRRSTTDVATTHKATSDVIYRPAGSTYDSNQQ